MSSDKTKRTQKWVPKTTQTSSENFGKRSNKPYSASQQQQYNRWVPKIPAKNTQNGTHSQSARDDFDRESKRANDLSNFTKAPFETRNRQGKNNKLIEQGKNAYVRMVDPTQTMVKVELVEGPVIHLVEKPQHMFELPIRHSTEKIKTQVKMDKYYEQYVQPHFDENDRYEKYLEEIYEERKGTRQNLSSDSEDKHVDELHAGEPVQEPEPVKIIPPKGFIFKPDEEWVSYDFNVNSSMLGCRFQYATEHKVKFIKFIPFQHGDSRPHHLLRATLLDNDPILIKVLHTTRQVIRLRPANFVTSKLARYLPFNAKTWRTVPGNRPMSTKVTISYNILTQLIQMNVSNRCFDSKTVHERMVQTARSIATINFDQYHKSLIDDTRAIAFIYSEYNRQTSTLDFYHPGTVIGGFFTDTNTESIRSHKFQQSNQNVKLISWGLMLFQLCVVLLSAYLLVPTLLDRLCPTLIKMTIEQLWPVAVSALRQQLLSAVRAILTDYVLSFVIGCVAVMTAAFWLRCRTFLSILGYEMRPTQKNARNNSGNHTMSSGSSRRAT